MNKTYSTRALITLCVAGTGVFADETKLETVVIIGREETPITSDLVGSVDLIGQEELAYQHVDDTLELFSVIPGLYVARYNQGIINTDIAIRGFAGDGVTPHAKLLIDGIPSNLHNGYNELDQLFPLSIASITVFKGTSDPRYGLFNLAGNYNVSTRQDQARELELTLGSFNTQEIQGYAGFDNDDGFSQSYTAGFRSNEGYRDHTDLTKYALGGNWAWRFNDAKTLRVIARHASYEGDSPGYYNDPQRARNQPTGSEAFAAQDGGEKTTSHLSLHWSQHFNDQMHWQLKAYTQNFERERWVRFSEASSLRNRYDDQAQRGFISTLSWSLDEHWSLDWGVDYEFQDVIEQRFNTVSVDSRQRSNDPADVRRDRAYEFSALGSYLQLFHEPSDKLRWNIALRADQLDGDYEDRDPDSLQTRDIQDFGTLLQPKFNVVYAATDNLSLFANAGRSFQHPFGADAYRASGAAPRDVSVNDGWELGSQLFPNADFTLRISYWQQTAKDEFINVDGNNLNVGETERSGVDIAFNGSLGEAWSYWGNFAYIDSEIIRAADALSDTQGNALRSIPSQVATLGLNYQVSENLIARFRLDNQGDYFINEANVGGKFGDYTLLSASADYDAGWATLKFQLNNITDEYYEYAFDFGNDAAFTIHSPGDGINGSVSINWTF
ncbi:MAG: TonB-dependent receptor [Cellvibrionaceae bacterium]|nr:TonB-dependent receptor [Cellvibrionaceae bacterium]